ncbi:uncharacterized protein PHACADRAFT_33933, partial [Phanerochaete carnosa HHB-10118-sp]
AKRDIGALTEEKEELGSTLKTRTAEVAQLKTQRDVVVAALAAEKKSARDGVVEITGKLEDCQVALQGLRSQLQAAMSDAVKGQIAINELRSENGRLHKTVSSLEADVQVAEIKIVRGDVRVTELGNQLKAATQELGSAQGRASLAQSALKQCQDTLRTHMTRKDKVAALSSKVESLEKENSDLSLSVKTLEDENAGLRADLARLANVDKQVEDARAETVLGQDQLKAVVEECDRLTVAAEDWDEVKSELSDARSKLTEVRKEKVHFIVAHIDIHNKLAVSEKICQEFQVWNAGLSADLSTESETHTTTREDSPAAISYFTSIKELKNVEAERIELKETSLSAEGGATSVDFTIVPHPFTTESADACDDDDEVTMVADPVDAETCETPKEAPNNDIVVNDGDTIAQPAQGPEIGCVPEISLPVSLAPVKSAKPKAASFDKENGFPFTRVIRPSCSAVLCASPRINGLTPSSSTLRFFAPGSPVPNTISSGGVSFASVWGSPVPF